MTPAAQVRSANPREWSTGFAGFHPLRRWLRWLPAIVGVMILSLACHRTCGAPQLIWDSTAKTVTVEPGATQATATFTATNISPSDVVATAVSTSCRCTRAMLPSLPSTIPSHGSAVLHVVVSLANGSAASTQSVWVESSAGAWRLAVTVARAPRHRI